MGVLQSSSFSLTAFPYSIFTYNTQGLHKKLHFHQTSRNTKFVDRFRRNIPVALTLMVRLLENFIIVSPIMATRPQNHPPFKNVYVCGGYVSQFCGCAAGRDIQPIAIKVGTKFSLDVRALLPFRLRQSKNFSDTRCRS